MLSDVPTLRRSFYKLPEDPFANDILIPGFSEATEVTGVFGWFTAAWIGKLAPGLAIYLQRQDAMPIQMTVSPMLFQKEREVADKVSQLNGEQAVERIAEVFEHGRADEDALARHTLDCLGWMLASKKLIMRIAVPAPDSNFHPKMWGFYDGSARVIANGSGNATGKGVIAGVEQMNVSVSWDEHDVEVFSKAWRTLDEWLDGVSTGITGIYELPEAIEEKIIRTAPDVQPTQADYYDAVHEAGSPGWAANDLETLKRRFAKAKLPAPPKLSIPQWLKWQSGDYAHQGEAVAAWETATKPENGILEMATGAGKTLTALICATRVQDRNPDSGLLIVVAAPTRNLVTQWRAEVAKFGLKAVAPALESNSTTSLTEALRQADLGGTVALVITNHMLCDPTFQRTLERRVNPNTLLLLIADEAHGLGADGFINNKPEFFKKRLGLTATPVRQYDEEGTQQVFEYFGKPVYKFGLDQAIGFCLTPYEYYVHASTLDSQELDDFVKLTQRIGAAIAQADHEKRDSLLIQRRRIVETAEAKYGLLRQVLEHRGPRSLTHALIYASGKNPEQFERIAEILDSLNIRWTPIKEGVSQKEVQRRFDLFAKGGYQVMLAKKLLDEGVDIPSTREAFIVASSSVEREWIQRRGRVLRQHEGKKFALIHDFLALPPASAATTDSLKNIINNEIDRAYAFAAFSQSKDPDAGPFKNIARIRSAYWPETSSKPIHLQGSGETLIAEGTPQGAPW